MPIVVGAQETVSRKFEMRLRHFGNAILHGTFKTNNLAWVRKDSRKSAGHLIILRSEQNAWSTVKHRLCP